MPGQKAPEDQRREEILRAAFTVAARERLTGLTVQQVAAEAGVSKGLVFFYFRSRDALLLALLDWLLDRTIVAHVPEEALALPTPRERLVAVLRSEVQRLPKRWTRVELFFDYWVMGTRHPEVREKIRSALGRYREALRPLADEVVRAEPVRYRATTAEGLAAVATSFIEGCAVQAVMDPEGFDVSEYILTVDALVGDPLAPAHRPESG